MLLFHSEILRQKAQSRTENNPPISYIRAQLQER